MGVRAGIIVAGMVAVLGSGAIAQKPAGAPAGERVARCMIKTAEAEWKGACRFARGENGSFAVTPLEGPVGGASTINVSVVRYGIAEVNGLTADGVNSRWGWARRWWDERGYDVMGFGERAWDERGCWFGQDFRICAY